MLSRLFSKTKPDPRVELKQKIEAATGSLTEVIALAKSFGFIVEMSLKDGALNLRLSERIFETTVSEKPQNPTKK